MLNIFRVTAILFLMGFLKISLAAEPFNLGGVSVGKITNNTIHWDNYTAADGINSSFPSSIDVNEIDGIGSTILVSLGNYDAGFAIGIPNGGEKIAWIHYSEKDGLPSNNTAGVAIRDSTLYITHRKGLSVTTVGSNTFTTYTDKDGIDNYTYLRNVAVEAVDAANTIYVSGVGFAMKKASDKRFTSYSTKDGLGVRLVYDMRVTPDHTIYICGEASTGIALSIGHENNGKIQWTNYSTATGLPSSCLSHLAVTQDGAIYVSSSETPGLYSSRDGGKNWQAVPFFAGMSHISDIKTKDNIIIVTNRGGLQGPGSEAGAYISIDKGMTWKRYTRDDGLYSTTFTGAAIGKSHKIYVSRFANANEHSEFICPKGEDLLRFLKDVDVTKSNAHFTVDSQEWDFKNYDIAPPSNHAEFIQAGINPPFFGDGNSYCMYQNFGTTAPDKFILIGAHTKDVLGCPTWDSPGNPQYWSKNPILCSKKTGAQSEEDCMMFSSKPLK
jgi:photosystem II stability/assembly factor-like uncharacterized protein